MIQILQNESAKKRTSIAARTGRWLCRTVYPLDAGIIRLMRISVPKGTER
jgi:hypothetical protein